MVYLTNKNKYKRFVFIGVVFFAGSFLFGARFSYALPGDYAIYQESTGTFDTNVTSFTGVPFDVQLHQDSVFTQAGDDVAVNLGEDGLYLACYNVYSKNDTYGNRMGWRTRLRDDAAGANWTGGWSSNYRRDANNDEYGIQGCGLLNANAGDDIEVQIQEISSNSSSHLTWAEFSHLFILQLDDHWDYIQLTSSAGQSVSTSHQNIQWDTLVGGSGDSITHSTVTNNDTITLEDGRYLAVYNVSTSASGTDNQRTSITSTLLRDGTVEWPYAFDYAYVRNLDNLGNGDTNRAFIISTTASAPDDYSVRFSAEFAASAGGQTVTPDTSISIIKLPDSADYFNAYNTSSFTIGGSFNALPISFDTTSAANDSFSYNTGTERGTFEQDGLFLMLAGGRSRRASGSARLTRAFNFWLGAAPNGDATNKIGRTTLYARGDQGTYDTFEGGFGMASLVEQSEGDIWWLGVIDTDNTTNQNDGNSDYLNSFDYGINIINVNTLFQASVATTGTQTATADPSSTNNDSGAAFVIVDETGHREVTGITITESGTIDAQNDLDNIELYYELDTSAPYDCASESYDGGETQYGSTDTDGFSGANGTSTFTGSVTINTESSMCVYVVYDVGSGASEDETIEFSIDSPDTDVTVGNGTIITTSTVAMSGTTTITAASGTLTVDIVDSGGTTVGSPTMAMNPIDFSFASQTATGTFSTSSEKIRVDNATGTATWTLSVAASSTTSLWDSAGTDYDFNDPTASAADGGDADSVGGQMTIDPSSITITPEGGCTSTNISAGSSDSFSEGITDTITIASAASGADTGCYWDITGIDVSQTIPAEQPAASDYNIDMVLSIIAS